MRECVLLLNGGQRMVRVGRNAKKIMILKITIFCFGDYVCNKGYKKGPNYVNGKAIVGTKQIGASDGAAAVAVQDNA